MLSFTVCYTPSATRCGGVPYTLCVLQVLIHGTEEATSSLAEFCHSTGVVQGNVFCPSVGDVIDATTERQIYQVSRPSVILCLSGPGNQPLATPPPELGRE